jgi:lysozyme family protein
MAKFDVAYHRTAKAEGGYSNDPDDRGGETWKGIARRMWPNWSGWKIVDQWKMQTVVEGDLKRALAADESLQVKVLAFYKQEFWDRLRGDEINAQDIANEIYDDAINTGIGSAIKKAQSIMQLPAIGVMNDETIFLINNQS